jgi:hypothetical protein
MLKAVAGTMVGVMALVGFTIGPTSADTTVLAHKGAWRAFGGTTDNHVPVCGVAASGPGMNFSLKYYYRDHEFTIQLGEESWSLKDGAHIRTTMQFDEKGPWQASGLGMHVGQLAALQFVISFDSMDKWIDEFRSSDVLYIRFPDSDVSDWRADLNGSDVIADKFGECIKVMSDVLR